MVRFQAWWRSLAGAVPAGQWTVLSVPVPMLRPVDAGELGLRSRDYDGWIGPALAGLLIERGHLNEVRLQAAQGDWTCALRLAEELDCQGERDSVLQVLSPYVGCGWYPAVDVTADYLDRWGRTGEAVSLVTPYAAAGHQVAVRRMAGLLAHQGRVDDAIALLGPRVDDWYLAQALVDLTDGQARDHQVLSLLPAPAPPGAGGEPWNALGLRARVLERQGRVNEAMTLLRAYIGAGEVLRVDLVKELAGLMARHGRLAELRELIAGRGGVHAAYSLFALHAGRAEVDEAVRVLSPFIADGDPDAAAKAAELLAAHGRADEAIEILKPLPAVICEPEWPFCMLLELLTSQGRAAEAARYIDDLAVRLGGMTEELFLLRARALADSGQREQAIAALRSQPQASDWLVREELAGLLAGDGRADEAIDVLRQPDGTRRKSFQLAKLLIQAGRIEEAVAVCQTRRSRG